MENELTIRRAVFKDARQIKKLVEACYGQNCSDRSFYSIRTVAKKILMGMETIYVAADAENRVLGMEACEPGKEFENTVFLKTKMTLPSARKQGIGGRITDYLMADFPFSNYRSAFAFALTYDPISQGILGKHGFVPTGLLYNSYLKCGRGDAREQKRSHMIMVRRHGPGRPLTLYVPKALRPFVEGVYRTFSVPVRFGEQRIFPSLTQTRLAVVDSDFHQNTQILIKACGRDLEKALREIVERYAKRPLQTFNLFLNMEDRAAIWGYERLKRHNFVFSGVKPFGEKEEYLVLYASGKVSVHMDALVMKPEYQKLKQYLEPFAERRITNEKDRRNQKPQTSN